MNGCALKFGKENIDVRIPKERLLGILDSRHTERTGSEEEIVRRALANPIGGPRLCDKVKKGEKVCIVICDITRSWQRTAVYLPFLVEELHRAGVNDADISFLSGTGTHREQTPQEHAALLGPDLAERFTVIDHKCEDAGELVFLGTTSYGTPVEVNRLALECDHLILTGGIVYHFMAGWGGGRKAVLPAISGYKTVMANHALALSPEGGRNMDCRSGNFEKNVLHLDMMEAAAMVNPSFLLNVILDASGLIGAAVAGDWKEAYFEGARIVDDNDAAEIRDLSDLVIASAGGFPKDINLYQTSKTIFNAMEAVRPGGALVVLSSCGEGFGNDEVRAMLTDFPDSPAREQELRREFTIAKYVGYTIGFVTENWDFHLVTDMEAAPLEKVGITVSGSLDEALAKVYARHGHDLSTWLMPHGANTLPKLAD